MPVNLVDIPTYTPVVTAPAGGDPRTAASVSTPLQELANRTANAKLRLDAPEQTPNVALSADQSNWAPAGWSTADVLRINPTGAGFRVLGLDATATVKRKTLVNIDSANSVIIAHNDGAQLAGNTVYCPGSVPYTLGPRSSVDVISDSTSGGWRVLDTCVISALGPIQVVGDPVVTRLIDPLLGVGAGAGGLWFTNAAGAMVTATDSVLLWLPVDLPSGSVITRVRMGITITGAPGAGQGPQMYTQLHAADFAGGPAVVTALTPTITGPIIAGSAVLTSADFSHTVARSTGNVKLALQAAGGGATQTALNWVEVRFTDMSIWNG
jgi:hypothetical protein